MASPNGTFAFHTVEEQRTRITVDILPPSLYVTDKVSAATCYKESHGPNGHQIFSFPLQSKRKSCPPLWETVSIFGGGSLKIEQHTSVLALWRQSRLMLDASLKPSVSVRDLLASSPVPLASISSVLASLSDAADDPVVQAKKPDLLLLPALALTRVLRIEGQAETLGSKWAKRKVSRA